MLAGWFARRYFFSKKSHSVINLIAGVSVVSVAVPVAAMIVLLSVFNGFEQLVRSMNSHFDADLTLTPREGQTFGIESLDTAALRRLPGVEAVSLALEQSALMEYRGRQAMVTVRGVADGYDRVVPVAECITAGDYAVRLGDLDRLVVGRGVAYELGLRSLGESDGVLYALRRTGFSSLLPVEGYTRRQAEVAGVFAADAQTDGRYLFTSLRLAQELFSYPDRASAAVVRVARGARPEEVKRRVAEAAGGAFEVRTRDELNASFYTIMQYEKWGIFLISLLVLVIASFSIVGTVVMLVLDKRPEFVALGAMGADRRAGRRSGRRAGRGAVPRATLFRRDRNSGRQLSGQELPRPAARGRRGGRRGGFRGRGGGDDGRDGAARGSCGRHGRRPHGTMTSSCFGRAEAGKRLLKTNGI